MISDQIKLCGYISEGKAEECEHFLSEHPTLLFKQDEQGFSPALFCLALMENPNPARIVTSFRMLAGRELSITMSLASDEKIKTLISESFAPVLQQNPQEIEKICNTITTKSQDNSCRDNINILSEWVRAALSPLRKMLQADKIKQLESAFDSLTVSQFKPPVASSLVPPSSVKPINPILWASAPAGFGPRAKKTFQPSGLRTGSSAQPAAIEEKTPEASVKGP